MRIDRLTLHAGPMSDAQARELAQLVAEEVAKMSLPPAGAVRVEVTRPATGGVASLRDAVARAVQAAVTGAGTDAGSPEGSGGRQ